MPHPVEPSIGKEKSPGLGDLTCAWMVEYRHQKVHIGNTRSIKNKQGLLPLLAMLGVTLWTMLVTN